MKNDETIEIELKDSWVKPEVKILDVNETANGNNQNSDLGNFS